MKIYLLVALLFLTGCTVSPKTMYLMGGLKDSNMELSACWVQPAHSDLWYPCDAEAVKDKECLNLMEQAMKKVDPYVEDPQLTSTPEEADPIRKFWDRAKQTCWSDLKDKQEKHYH